jgi:NOL1/NOP2/fmu family ribosome biogenesis protein
LTGWPLEPIPWCPNGAYIDPSAQAGSHPFHAAGLYYLQEPTAMAVAEIAEIEPGAHVLDLAASPGGKSTQITSALGATGLLVANEILPSRIKGLGENLERWGTVNAIITNRTPAQLESLGPVFDRVVVDAPCSGEGLFRRDPDARGEWSPKRVQGSARRQREILASAVKLLAPGGKLIYSTCTFNRTENEDAIADLLDSHKSLQVEQTLRLWPHQVRGEGHSITRLGNGPVIQPTGTSVPPRQLPSESAWSTFASQMFESDPINAWSGKLVECNGRVALEPIDSVASAITRSVRSGLWLGDVKPGRFEPSHSLALAVDPKLVRNRLDLSIDDAHRWIAGDPLQADGPPGWILITVTSFALGWGKRTGTTVKNHYPHGLRRQERTEN